MKFTVLHTIDTEYPADSIEWCPFESYRTHFVCGTYKLVEKDNESSLKCERKGRLYLYKFIAETNELIELQRIETGAILDMKWSQPTTENTYPILATANALGQVEIYELVDGKSLNCRICINLKDTESTKLLALSLDWNASGQGLLVSDSQGNINLLDYSSAGIRDKFVLKHTWSAHNFEAWICAFDKWDVSRAYTGGDDCLLHAYDIRSKNKIWTNSKHTAGVTSLLSHPIYDHMLVTGSYDEILRVFDTRFMKHQPVNELKLNGGIWRIKQHPRFNEKLLIACMYENFSVVNFSTANCSRTKSDVGGGEGDGVGDESSQQLSLGGIFTEHGSICYGADWCQTSNESTVLHMATCSFYDNKLCVTKVEEDQ